jgi:DNA-binding Lrp family transcriptional regulator
MGHYVGLSTNATKARIKRLISNGTIRQYYTTINLSAFGFSKIVYIFLRTSKKWLPLSLICPEINL